MQFVSLPLSPLCLCLSISQPVSLFLPFFLSLLWITFSHEATLAMKASLDSSSPMAGQGCSRDSDS